MMNLSDVVSCLDAAVADSDRSINNTTSGSLHKVHYQGVYEKEKKPYFTPFSLPWSEIGGYFEELDEKETQLTWQI